MCVLERNFTFTSASLKNTVSSKKTLMVRRWGDRDRKESEFFDYHGFFGGIQPPSEPKS